MKLKKLKQKKTLIILIRAIMYLKKTFINRIGYKVLPAPNLQLPFSFTYPPAM